MDITAGTPELDAVRRRRAELLETLAGLEAALAAPASRRAVIWGEQVSAAVSRLADEFVEHVEVTEGPDGLHQSILSGDLRLANAVAALTTEHATIAAAITALARACEAPVSEAEVADLRERGTNLLVRLARHRQRGADLIYEAFATDIGGGD